MYTVLLVDDESVEREGLRFLIEKGEYNLNILEAANGEDALALVEKKSVDILITDIRMPFMDGLELARRIRRDDADMKILISTAYGEFEYARQAIKSGASGYLLKPVSCEQFYQELNDAIRQLDAENRRMKDVLSGKFWYELESGTTADDESLLSQLDALRREIQAQMEKKDRVGANAQIEMFVACLRALGNASLMYTRYMAMEVLTAMRPNDPPEARRRAMARVSAAMDSAELASLVEERQTALLHEKPVGRADEDAIERIIQVIRDQYAEPLTLEGLAKRAYLAPSYVSYLFKRRTGSTLIRYIADYRMKKAADFLTRGTQPVTLIAQWVGYDNSSYFSAVFRAHYGVSPAQYRRDHQKEAKPHGETVE